MSIPGFSTRIWCLTASLIAGVAGSGGLPAQTPPPGTDPESLSLRAELLFWESMKDSRNPEELRAYIDAYPDGRFALLARARLKALSQEAGAEASGAGGKLATAAPGDPPAKEPGTGAPKPGETFRDCDACPEMTVVPAGRFEMGSGNHGAEERPVHEVAIPRDFGIGVYEVTAGEWDACVTDGACRQSPQADTGEKMPAANISWDDAQDYVTWLSAKTGEKYRLPSEAEWEYAARAGTATAYWWGDEGGKGSASCADCGNPWDGERASPAGSFAANPFGLFDVHGNVWEWVQDCWNPDYEGATADGSSRTSGDCRARVLRGGGWSLGQEYLRSSRRTHYDHDVRYPLHGLRVARDLPAVAAEDPTFEAAVSEAAHQVFSNAPRAGSDPGRRVLAMDPVVDGLSGSRSAATEAMQSRIMELVESGYPQLEMRALSAASLAETPYVVIGTFTGVNKERKPAGERVAYRICLALLDLEAGTVASKAKVFSQTEGVDITPTRFFRDSPAWTPDPSAQAYIRSCQATKPGDPIDPLYVARIRSAALLNEAIEAYEQERYEASRDLFESAARGEGGDQMRALNGLYLTSWRLGDLVRAPEAFARIVDYGLSNGRLGVKFPFRPDSTAFLVDPREGVQHDLWLTQIARQTAPRDDCFEVTGHGHRLRSERDDEDLALRRAEYIKRRLEAEAPELRARMRAAAGGPEGDLVGSGTDDARDALDRRIELATVKCPPSTASSQ
jgi:formylglycine-generating enzyme required for sulfatase activity